MCCGGCGDMGRGDPLIQLESWSCGASVCFLGNRERKPPFRRPGRPQQPHTQIHTDSHAAAHTQPPASASACCRLRGVEGGGSPAPAQPDCPSQKICLCTRAPPLSPSNPKTPGEGQKLGMETGRQWHCSMPCQLSAFCLLWCVLWQ